MDEETWRLEFTALKMKNTIPVLKFGVLPYSINLIALITNKILLLLMKMIMVFTFWDDLCSIHYLNILRKGSFGKCMCLS